MNTTGKISNMVLRNLFLLLFAFLGSINCKAQFFTERIALNQVGFYPMSPKLAIVTGEVVANDFYITTTSLRDTLFHGKLSASKQSAYSSTITRSADFSTMNIKGSYVLVVPGSGVSYVFRIDDEIYEESAIATLKGFYYQRVSMPLEKQYAGKLL